MGKKKSKKNQKGSSSTTSQTTDDKKKIADMSEEEIDRGDDLYISESDTNLISNFIRTTNKSFNSLGNTIVETFASRCALGLAQAIMSLYYEHSDDREDVIRRLNIIYIIYRLPEIEQELRVKPQKNIHDIYNHMFSPFLFYAAKCKLKTEACFARVIVSNNSSTIEKLTATDFIKRVDSFIDNDFDFSGFDKWEKENTSHWPKFVEEDVPVATLMRVANCDRKDFEAGSQEAFYPLHQPFPTMTPLRLSVMLEEVKDEKTKHLLEKKEDLYSNDSDGIWPKDMKVQMKLVEAFKTFHDDIINFGDEQMKNFNEQQLKDAKKVVKLADREKTIINCYESIAEDIKPMKKKSSNVVNENNESEISDCIEKLAGIGPLSAYEIEKLCGFVKNAKDDDPLLNTLGDNLELEENINILITYHHRTASDILCRLLRLERKGVLERVMSVISKLDYITVQSMEVLLRMSQELDRRGNVSINEKRCITDCIRQCMKTCERLKNPRSVRLLSMLTAKLLRTRMILVNDIACDVQSFTLKFSWNSDATSLFILVQDMRRQGAEGGDEESVKKDIPGPSNS